MGENTCKPGKMMGFFFHMHLLVIYSLLEVFLFESDNVVIHSGDHRNAYNMMPNFIPLIQSESVGVPCSSMGVLHYNYVVSVMVS